MPIYAYRCSNCGHAQDVLQRMSDPVLSVCPACGQPTYVKQVTAAGFQLKGSGWYVTDFRGDKKAAPAADADKAAPSKARAPPPAPRRRPARPQRAATPAAEERRRRREERRRREAASRQQPHRRAAAAPAPAPAPAPAASGKSAD